MSGTKANSTNTIQIALFGAANVGKYQMLQRFIKDDFRENEQIDITESYKKNYLFQYNKNISHIVLLEITYIANDDIYHDHDSQFFQRIIEISNVFLLVYSIDNAEKSFNKIKEIYEKIEKYQKSKNICQKTPIVVACNKCDIMNNENDLMEQTANARQCANENGWYFFQTSAKDRINIIEIFEQCIKVVLETRDGIIFPKKKTTKCDCIIL